MIDLKALTQRYDSLRSRIRVGKAEHTAQIRAMREHSLTQMEYERKVEQSINIHTDYHTTAIRLEHEILDQKRKLENALRDWKLARKTACFKVFNNCTDMASDAAFAAFKRQLKVREQGDRIDLALQHLAEMMNDFSDTMKSDISKQLLVKGLAVPQRHSGPGTMSAIGVCGSANRSVRSTSLSSSSSSLKKGCIERRKSVSEAACVSSAGNRLRHSSLTEDNGAMTSSQCAIS